jgi:hypothetical protein
MDLGLHLDTFLEDVDDLTPSERDERDLRICLWSTVILLDRSTSLLFGRPLVIATGNVDIRQISMRRETALCSPNFLPSILIAGIQADIVEAFYSWDTGVQSAEQILTNTSRILQSIGTVTEQLPTIRRCLNPVSSAVDQELLQQVPCSEAILFLQSEICRVLLLRLIVVSEKAPRVYQERALENGTLHSLILFNQTDFGIIATIASHNIIAIHVHFQSSPGFGLFMSYNFVTSAAMTIMWAYQSRISGLPSKTTQDDVSRSLVVLSDSAPGDHRRGTMLISRAATQANLSICQPSAYPQLIADRGWCDERLADALDPTEDVVAGGSHLAFSDGLTFPNLFIPC